MTDPEASPVGTEGAGGRHDAAVPVTDEPYVATFPAASLARMSPEALVTEVPLNDLALEACHVDPPSKL